MFSHLRKALQAGNHTPQTRQISAAAKLAICTQALTAEQLPLRFMLNLYALQLLGLLHHAQCQPSNPTLASCMAKGFTTLVCGAWSCA